MSPRRVMVSVVDHCRLCRLLRGKGVVAVCIAAVEGRGLLQGRAVIPPPGSPQVIGDGFLWGVLGSLHAKEEAVFMAAVGVLREGAEATAFP